MQKHFTFLFLLGLMTTFCHAQPDVEALPAGKCYAKCKMRPKPIIDKEKIEEAKLERQAYFVYMGNNPSAFTATTVYEELPTARWELRDCSKPCDPDIPGACATWLLHEDGGTKANINVCKDTALYKPFTTDYYYPLAKNKKWWEAVQTQGDEVEDVIFEWREVFCDSKITPAFIKKLVTALEAQGLLRAKDVDFSTSPLHPELKAALSKYQVAHDLPIGNLNLTTLQSLGLIF
jgi:hypothetical protein